VADSVTVAISGVYAQGLIGDETESVIVPTSGVEAQGQVGDTATRSEIALVGAEATGDVGSVGKQSTQSLVGVDASGELGTVTPSVVPDVIITGDTHDGDREKRRQKKWQNEQEARERRKRELIDVYEQLVEGRPSVAAQIVKPYVKPATRRTAEPTIDWNKLVADVERVQALYREYQEMDDEDVLLLL
jgi:hypothetical protein